MTATTSAARDHARSQAGQHEGQGDAPEDRRGTRTECRRDVLVA